MMTAEGFSDATDFLSTLVGKHILVMLTVSGDGQGPHLLSGILTSVYTNAILLSRQNSEQLIYLHAVATIQEASGGEQAFQAKIATVPGTADSSESELSAKYIGE
ncbi:MAG: hypothetical protein ACLQUY_20205 [Ktedonobacterales bacterium]